MSEQPSADSRPEEKQEQREKQGKGALPSWARTDPPGPKPRVRVGFAGAGRYSTHHLKALTGLEGVEIGSILGAGGLRAARRAEEFGIDRVFEDLERFLEQDDVDCFVLVVPPRAMVEVASACLATGKPVLLEKPPGVTSADAESLVGAAEDAGTWAMVGLNRRFYSVVEHGLAALADLGPVRGAVLEVPQRITEQRDSGRLTDFDYEHFYVRNSIHGIDLLRYVLGDPLAVHSRTWPNRELANRSASYAAILEYEDGVMATVLDLWDTLDQERLKVVAESGWVEWELPRGWVTAKKKKSKQPIPVDPVDDEFRPGVWAQDLRFVEAVRAGREPSLPAATLRDALGTMRLIESILADSLAPLSPLRAAPSPGPSIAVGS